MKSHRPSPRTGAPSANRIRERYLHQLGLQRGSQPQGPLTPSTNQHVVVIGLPSLPEERATNDVSTNLQLESHDFSNYQNKGDSSHHTIDSEIRDSGSHAGDGESDSASSHKRSRGHPPRISFGNELNVPITSLALSYPTAILKPPPATNESAPAQLSKKNLIAQWFAKGVAGQSDAVKHHITDQDSVTSTATSTTAGSSFTAMVSKDWGSTASAQNNDPIRAENAMSSSAIQGVHYHCTSTVRASNTSHCPTSSLTHALNKFNIDSDCDASLASGSVVGGGNSIMTEEDHIMDEDDVSVHSHASFMSVGSHKSHLSSSARARGRKAGKAQRLLDRAAAHERILQIRNEQSQKTRANLIHTQRMGNSQDSLETRSRSSSISSQSSIPLLYVRHGDASQAPAANLALQSLYGCDLSRTPTASNCSDLRKIMKLQAPMGLAYPQLNCTIPTGAHILSGRGQVVTSSIQTDTAQHKPLGFHPQLASSIPSTRPLPARSTTTEEVSDITSSSTSVLKSPLLAHRRQTSVEDVLEVVEALSRLKGERKIADQ